MVFSIFRLSAPVHARLTKYSSLIGFDKEYNTNIVHCDPILNYLKDAGPKHL